MTKTHEMMLYTIKITDPEENRELLVEACGKGEKDAIDRIYPQITYRWGLDEETVESRVLFEIVDSVDPRTFR